MPQITRSFQASTREGLTWDERWKGEDRGLIACWERGREKRLESPQLAEKASNGELVVLGWQGGVEKAIQKKHKFGSLNYLATWQGLRGEDLDINVEQQVQLVCSSTKMTVTFTSDAEKYVES